MCIEFLFFFSSRRRHTRYWRDWSSDVCSSDLTIPSTGSRVAGATPREQCLGDGSAVIRDGRDRPGRAPRRRQRPRRGSKIGRGSCRERGEILGVAVSLKKKKIS